VNTLSDALIHYVGSGEKTGGFSRSLQTSPCIEKQSINPARDLGPRLAHAFLPIPCKGSSDWSYSGVPIFGPLCGAIIAAVFIRFTGI